MIAFARTIPRRWSLRSFEPSIFSVFDLKYSMSEMTLEKSAVHERMSKR